LFGSALLLCQHDTISISIDQLCSLCVTTVVSEWAVSGSNRPVSTLCVNFEQGHALLVIPDETAVTTETKDHFTVVVFACGVATRVLGGVVIWVDDSVDDVKC